MEIRRLLPHAPGLLAKRVNDPPEASAVALPRLLTEAIVGEDDTQAAVLERVCVVRSEKVPVAVNCTVCPLRGVTFAGVRAREVNTGATTTTLTVGVFPCHVAVMVTAGVCGVPLTRAPPVM